MKKIIFVIGMLYACTQKNSQQNDSSPNSSLNLEDSLRIEPVNFDKILHNKAYIYADSLNHSEIQSLPKFLMDVDFDYRDTFLLTGGTFISEHYSLRIEIFKNVNRKDLLDFIARDTYFIDQFKKLHRNGTVRRFDGFSNADLARIRLLEINTGKDSLSVLQ